MNANLKLLLLAFMMFRPSAHAGAPPVFLRVISQTRDQRVPLGGTATFQVRAEGSEQIHYQWIRQNAIDGATNAFLTITNVSLADVGGYGCSLWVVNGTITTSSQIETVYLELDSPRRIDHWQRLSPKFGNAELYGIATGGGITVITAGNGMIWNSANRIDWAPANSPVFDALLEVTYGNSQFVAVGSQPSRQRNVDRSQQRSTLVTSSDGINWQAIKSPTLEPLLSVAFGAGRFVAVSQSRGFSSVDGVKWSTSTLNINGLVKVRFVNNRFIALGPQRVAISLDGLSWKENSSPANLFSVAGDGKEYIALEAGFYSGIWRSSNAVNWVMTPITWDPNPSHLSGFYFASELIFGNGKYAALGYFPGGLTEGAAPEYPLLATSQDGSVWDIKRINSEGVLWSAIPDESGFLAVGNLGILTSISETGSVLSRGSITRVYAVWPFVQSPRSLIIPAIEYTLSDDLKTWRSLPRPYGTGLLLYGNGFFLTIGGTNYFTSADGVSWSAGVLPFNADSYFFLGFDGKRFIGSFFETQSNNNVVAISTNAVDWTRAKGLVGFNQFSGANGLAIVSQRYDGNSYSGFVSTNGIDWIARRPFTQPEQLVFDGTRYVGVGAADANVPMGVFVSEDGIHWTISTNSPFALSHPATIAYGAGTYVVASSSQFDPKLLVSTDARNWDLILTGSREPIADVTFFKGHWVILGSHGEILESIPLSTLKLNPTNNNLTVSGEGNSTYELQASEDLNSATWLPLTTLQTDPDGSASTNLSLPPATNLFLRLKQSN